MDVSLTTNDLRGNVAYPGQEVIFICRIATTHDVVISWKSVQYIGDGDDVLQVTSIDPLGYSTSNRQNPTTIATLVSKRHRNGMMIVISHLRIIASDKYPFSRVHCKANGGQFQTVTFRTSMFGEP